MNLFTFSQYHSQNGHSYVHSIFGLSEVGGSWIGVEFLADFVDARQWMHDDHTTLGQCHELGRDDKVTAHLPVFVFGGKSFLLNASHVEYVGFRQGFGQ